MTAKNQQLADAAKEEAATLREEFQKEKEFLMADSSLKIADLRNHVARLRAANQDLLQDKAKKENIIVTLLSEKKTLQAEVQSLKKEPKGEERIRVLEEEVGDLKDELDDLELKKNKSDQMNKVAFQDGFCLARHQVLQRFPGLDLSFLEGLNIPGGPRWKWSKIEHLKLPP